LYGFNAFDNFIILYVKGTIERDFAVCFFLHESTPYGPKRHTVIFSNSVLYSGKCSLKNMNPWCQRYCWFGSSAMWVSADAVISGVSEKAGLKSEFFKYSVTFRETLFPENEYIFWTYKPLNYWKQKIILTLRTIMDTADSCSFSNVPRVWRQIRKNRVEQTDRTANVQAVK
jgi:hypothetical protein